MAVALGDLRIAVQVDAGAPQRRLLDERAQDHVAAVRPAVDGQPAVRPGLLGRPARGVDQVVDVGVAPLVVVGHPERPAVAGRPAEVDVEEREPGRDEDLLERLERAERLAGRAAVREDDDRGARPAALAGRRVRAPQGALDAEAVAGGDDDPFRLRDARRRQGVAQDGRQRVGDLARARVVRRDARDRAAATGPAARSRARRSPRPTPRPRSSRPTARRRPTG